jgi:hypothetical protein
MALNGSLEPPDKGSASKPAGRRVRPDECQARERALATVLMASCPVENRSGGRSGGYVGEGEHFPAFPHRPSSHSRNAGEAQPIREADRPHIHRLKTRPEKRRLLHSALRAPVETTEAGYAIALPANGRGWVRGLRTSPAHSPRLSLSRGEGMRTIYAPRVPRIRRPGSAPVASP